MPTCTMLSSAHFWRSVMIEIFGTFILLTVQCSLPLSWKSDDMGQVVQIALGMGIVVMVLIEMFSPLGDAHFNPAVTIAMLVARKVSIGRAIIYMVAQCAGAILGAYFTFGITPPGFHDTLAVTALHPNVSPVKGVIVECWLTMMLVMTIFGATSPKRTASVSPALPIGFAVSLDILAGIRYTGASLNPARSLGPALVMHLWDHQWVYWVGPICGGVLASLIYHYLFMSERMFPVIENTERRQKTQIEDDSDVKRPEPNNNAGDRVTWPEDYWPVKSRDEKTPPPEDV